MYISKTQVLGNLTRDPELKALPTGMKVCNFSVATNRSWKDKNTGAKKEEVEFHNIVCFGKTADVIAEWFHKGDQIYVEGRNKTTNWAREDGSKAYKTEIVLENFQFGTKKGSTSPKNAPGESKGAKDEDVIEYPTEEAPEGKNEPTATAQEDLSDIPF